MIQCPFCKHEFERNCEYVDIGVGEQQVTPNYCPACGAYEQGLNHVPSPLHADLHGWSKSRVVPYPHPTDPTRAIAIVIVDIPPQASELDMVKKMKELGFMPYVLGLSVLNDHVTNIYYQEINHDDAELRRPTST